MSRTSPNFATIDDTYSTIATPRANGRVDISAVPKAPLQVPGYGPKKAEDNSTFCQEAILGNWTSSDLSRTFFSVDNIEALQQGIRYLVFKKTGKTIGRQSDQELKIIMKGIYLQNAQHNPAVSVLEQVRSLNQLVLDFAVDKVLTNLLQYEKYRQDVSTLPTPMERSQAMSQKGTKVLEMPNFI